MQVQVFTPLGGDIATQIPTAANAKEEENVTSRPY